MQHRLQCEGFLSPAESLRAGQVRLFNFKYIYEVFLRPLEDAGMSAGREEEGELKITSSHFLFIQIKRLSVPHVEEEDEGRVLLLLFIFKGNKGSVTAPQRRVH